MLYNFREVLNIFTEVTKIIMIFFFLLFKINFDALRKNSHSPPPVIYLKTEQEVFQDPWSEFSTYSFWEQQLGKKHLYEMVRSSIWSARELALCLVIFLYLIFCYLLQVALLANEYLSYCQDILHTVRKNELDEVCLCLNNTHSTLIDSKQC